MHYKKVRRLCTEPYKDNKPIMHTLYECHAKNGTTASTIIWFLAEPKIGGYIWGIDENTKYSPYMAGQAFRYARFERFFIDDIYRNGYVVCHQA